MLVSWVISFGREEPAVVVVRMMPLGDIYAPVVA